LNVVQNDSSFGSGKTAFGLKGFISIVPVAEGWLWSLPSKHRMKSL
jgi:hypothetical protein